MQAPFKEILVGMFLLCLEEMILKKNEEIQTIIRNAASFGEALTDTKPAIDMSFSANQCYKHFVNESPYKIMKVDDFVDWYQKNKSIVCKELVPEVYGVFMGNL